MKVLELEGITKKFGNLTAVEDLDFDLEYGEIHALLGENGAGKSTLMNLIYGLYKPDVGQIRISGNPVVLNSPRDAISCGIGMVHQHFMLVQNLTVAENIALGLTDRGFRFRRNEAFEKVRDLSRRFGFDINPEAYAWQLSVGLQQRAEILKALAAEAQILIFDEPTAVLAPQEVGELFSTLRQLAADGCAIIFISHKLKEVMEISDRVTVMRHGLKTHMDDTANTSIQVLADYLMGDEFPIDKKEKKQGTRITSDEVALRVEELVVRGDRGEIVVQGVSLEVRRGEIVGIAGGDGNGQVELADALMGLRKVVSGEITFCDIPITYKTTAERRGLGVAYIPEDRQAIGLVVEFSVSENLMLDVHHLRAHRKRGLLNRSEIGATSERLIADYDIRTPSKEVSARTLSGGNQQKIVLAREMSRNPELLIAVNPTRGLDINSTKYVHENLLTQRKQSQAVLLISTDLDEVLALSDRLFVISDGTLLEGTSKRNNPTDLGLLMTGVKAYE